MYNGTLISTHDYPTATKGSNHSVLTSLSLQVTLDCTRLKERMFSLKNIWSVGVSSVPRIYDLHANNPGTNILESYYYWYTL